MSSHVGAGNETWVLWKSKQSELLTAEPSLQAYIYLTTFKKDIYILFKLGPDTRQPTHFSQGKLNAINFLSLNSYKFFIMVPFEM